jgi:hypothetical protein
LVLPHNGRRDFASSLSQPLDAPQAQALKKNWGLTDVRNRQV